MGRCWQLWDGAPAQFPAHAVSIMDQSVLVAIARFPDRGHAIEELARRDEDFRSLCADLADAEAAAVRWEHSCLPISKTRSAEYRELARDLAAELAATLDRHAQP
jgi:hypothetical protein